jgi:hypothetical protein
MQAIDVVQVTSNFRLGKKISTAFFLFSCGFWGEEKGKDREKDFARWGLGGGHLGLGFATGLIIRAGWVILCSVSRTKAKAFDAVPKMGEGLPEPACRSWLQTARCRCVQKAWW